MNILIIDDEEPVCKYISAVLIKAGHKCFTNDGGSYIDIVNKNKIDMFIVDYHCIGSKDGLEIIVTLRADVPAYYILITGDGNVKEKCIDSIPVLYKPFMPEELLNLVNNYEKQRNEIKA